MVFKKVFHLKEFKGWGKMKGVEVDRRNIYFATRKYSFGTQDGEKCFIHSTRMYEIKRHNHRKKMNRNANAVEEERVTSCQCWSSEIPHVKFWLYCLSWLFMLIGSLVLIIGVYQYEKFNFIEILVSEEFKPDSYLIALGIMVSIVGLIGSVAVCNLKVCQLYWYVLCLVMIMGVYLPVGFTALKTSVDDFKSKPGINEVMNGISNYSTANNSTVQLIHQIQDTLKCCGFSKLGYMDWNGSSHFICDQFNYAPEKCSVPISCCKDNYKSLHCGGHVLNRTVYSKIEIENRIHTRGCLQALDSSMKYACSTLGTLTICISIVALVSLFLTGVLVKKVKIRNKSLTEELINRLYTTNNNVSMQPNPSGDQDPCLGREPPRQNRRNPDRMAFDVELQHLNQ